MSKNEEFINKTEEDKIIAAIKTAEQNTSGEIRIHITPNCKGDIATQAKKVFFKLNMDKTRLRNGVLICLVANKRQFFILGDQGIHEKVPEDFWESTSEIMAKYFKKGDFVTGLTKGILMAGEQLKTHFPHLKDDVNELPDEISRG